MTTRCELCTASASMYCESDQASLCWDCDAKVHSANFLVARHSRTLLCHVCRSPTAWSASGEKLCRTVSLCQSCVCGRSGLDKVSRGVDEDRGGHSCYNKMVAEDDDDYEEDEDDDEDLDGSDEEEEDLGGEDEEDEDNQVVPSTLPPPPSASSSFSGDDSSSMVYNGDEGFPLKRSRDRNADSHSEDDFGCSSSNRNITPRRDTLVAATDSRAACIDSLNRLKRPRTQSEPVHTVQRGPAGVRMLSIVDSLKRLYQQEVTSGHNAPAVTAGIRELSENPAKFGSDSDKAPWPHYSR